ncbi:unnamed protein product [Protopolystoma xenopodis]|uniref:Uncharacterized protein n=1 Tax=Protopolystoma xenopodis TaxID=117903 RepID=A0A3S5CGJ5_9PLAT|nr:unnamed protein product [Protopolystoma xenopodis]
MLTASSILSICQIFRLRPSSLSTRQGPRLLASDLQLFRFSVCLSVSRLENSKQGVLTCHGIEDLTEWCFTAPRTVPLGPDTVFTGWLLTLGMKP